MVFATLKDELSATEKALIAEFATWGRERLADRRPRAPVIVLTGIEMFAPWYISESWKDRGGVHARLVAHPSVNLDNPWTLANFTQQLYLDLPDPYAHPAPVTAEPGRVEPAEPESAVADDAPVADRN